MTRMPQTPIPQPLDSADSSYASPTNVGSLVNAQTSSTPLVTPMQTAMMMASSSILKITATGSHQMMMNLHVPSQPKAMLISVSTYTVKEPMKAATTLVELAALRASPMKHPSALMTMVITMS